MTGVKVITILMFSILKKIASGKKSSELDKDDWKDIAADISQYAVLADDQQNSVFIFSLYESYIRNSVVQIEEIISEETAVTINRLADELHSKADALGAGYISEVTYIEDCLWISLEAMIKLLLVLLHYTGWKKTLSAIFASGASGVGLWGVYEKYGINDYTQVFTSIGIFSLFFLLTFIVFMAVLCRIMRDKDDKDVLRIRDIPLGQKSYIQKYYEKRAREIDEKLNIPALEKRESDVALREQHLNAQREVFEREKEDFSKLTEGKLKIKLPEKKNLTVTKEFLDLFPSYVDGLAAFIEGIKKETALFLDNHDKVTSDDLKVFLTLISIQILEHLFGKGSKDVRVHFRFYDEKKNGYKKLVSVIGDKESKRDLTFIPYDKANMIKKSFECKRALIKSHNIDYDYVGNNSTTWAEYMTGAFYNITRENKPWPGGKFCVSVFRQNQEYHVINVHDGAYSPWLQLSRKVGAVCAPCTA